MKKNTLALLIAGLASQSSFASSHANNQFVVDDQFTVHTSESQIFDVLKNDIGENLVIESALSGYGKFEVTGDKVLFTPSEEVLAQPHPQAKFGYTVMNEKGERETGIVTVNYDLSIENHAPVAMDDHLYAAKNQPVFANVLKNDYDPDEGDVLSVSEALSYDAVVEILEDGSLRVDRIKADKTPIEVVYNLVDDHGNHDYGTLTIDYLADEDMIMAKDDLYSSLPKNESFSLPVLENDVIANDNTSISSLISKLDVVKTNGNEIIFTPTEGFDYSTPYKFGYTISSNGNYDTAIVTLEFDQATVNHPPILQEDVVYADDRLGSVRISPLENDTDQDNDSLILTAAFSESGNTEIDGDDVIFTPNDDFDGDEAQIIYEASDNKYDGKVRQKITVRYTDSTSVCE
ncbi:hypothetical protein CGK40_25015 [Vibrio parahaemolyticus]|uniref:Ig-like domain-containing protein n=1 Tax=Vibrio parahaemolyticus TaxID=670 RepID=UPI00111E1321|nr:Ig-like domain-containing protein [Vibrio parahaemolyticus]TNZ85295.1 hypothetical protein CGK40_25015 [Vibrio parahaemolyticus]